MDKATARDIVPIVRANVDKASKFIDRRSALPVKETFQGKTVWEGTVHVFDLEEHPRATRAYALSHLVGETGERRRFFAVLHLGCIRSPVDAVRAAIVAENKGRR